MKKIFLIVFGIWWWILFLIFLPVIISTWEIIILNSIQLTELKVKENTLIMNNEINSKTPEQFKKIFSENPNIDTIIMKEVSGSLDDTANLKISSWIAQKWLTIKLEKDSYIASWGTDFFLAGKHRIIENGAQVWVHSWAGGWKTANDFPVWHENHLPYIEYYKRVGWTQKQAEDFYYFTINSAPASEIYIMSNEELEKFNVSTTKIQ